MFYIKSIFAIFNFYNFIIYIKSKNNWLKLEKLYILYRYLIQNAQFLCYQFYKIIDKS